VNTYKIASIPGDGIGNEVIPAGIEVLKKLEDGFRLEFEHFDWSSKRYVETGRYIPEGGLEKLKRFPLTTPKDTGKPVTYSRSLRASALAIPRPMPLVEPVTRAVFPFSMRLLLLA